MSELSLGTTVQHYHQKVSVLPPHSPLLQRTRVLALSWKSQLLEPNCKDVHELLGRGSLEPYFQSVRVQRHYSLQAAERQLYRMRLQPVLRPGHLRLRQLFGQHGVQLHLQTMRLSGLPPLLLGQQHLHFLLPSPILRLQHRNVRLLPHQLHLFAHHSAVPEVPHRHPDLQWNYLLHLSQRHLLQPDPRRLPKLLGWTVFQHSTSKMLVPQNCSFLERSQMHPMFPSSVLRLGPKAVPVVSLPSALQSRSDSMRFLPRQQALLQQRYLPALPLD